MARNCVRSSLGPEFDLVQVDIFDLHAQPFEPSTMGLVRQPEVEFLLIGPRHAGVWVDDIAATAPPHKGLEAFETEIGEVIRQVGVISLLACLVERGDDHRGERGAEAERLSDVGPIADARNPAAQHEVPVAGDQPRRGLVGLVRRARDQVRPDASLVEIVEADAEARLALAAAEGQQIVDLAIGGVQRILDPIVGEPVVPRFGAPAHAGDEHALVFRHAEPLAEGNKIGLVARLVAPKIGRDVLERLVLPLGQEHDAFERQRDHPGVIGVDIRGAHELPPNGQLLIGKRHARVDLAEGSDLIAVFREIERVARVRRRVKRLGRVEDAAELEKVGDETRLIAEIAAGGQCLGGSVAEGVLAEPVGPAVGFDLGIAKERSRLLLLALGLEPLLALITVWLRSLQVVPRVERTFEPLADRTVGFVGGRGQRIRGDSAVGIA